MRRALRRSAGVAAVVVLCAPAATPAHAANDGLFHPDSYRNKPLAANAPLDPNSGLYAADLRMKVSQMGVWVNTDYYSYPIYTVPAGHPTRPVEVRDNPDHANCLVGNPCLPQQWAAVPLPDDATPAVGSDGHLVVHQPSSDTFWEFWRFRWEPDGTPVATYGGRMEDVSTNPGHFTDPPGDRFGASATSIPLLAGVQRIAELQAGVIDHAVSVAIAEPGDAFRWPAQREDGDNKLPWAVHEGMRFRLPASLNIDALNLPDYAEMVAKAVQKHGMVVSDGMADGPLGEVGLVFYAEDPTPTGSDPYDAPGGIFDGIGPNEAGQFRNFPWDKLQVLANP
jgi:hypothetical protein